jgi:hypothetical protein
LTISLLRAKFLGKLLAVLAVSICLASPGRSQEQAAARIYVVLWFDTEDYILPQSDDAAKRLAVFLTQQGIRATFKLVGEKGRTLERRGRQDVIGALAQHEIGYHSNTHSQHPTVAEYESALGWEAGGEEFTRRERPGWEDLRRIFGQAPTCYGQPGSSWAPQVHAALKKWGVRIYLDEAQHVGLNGKPFWYGGILNIFNTIEGPQLRPNDEWSNLADAKAKFQGFYLRMTSQPKGGLISLYFHPCEFIHREFWDAVNFARGANPPRDQWKLPPRKSPEEAEKAFQYFEGLITYMKSFPRVEFVTASEAAKLYRDAAQKRVFSGDELGAIASQVEPEVSFQVHENYTLSASEVFYLLTKFVAQAVSRKAPEPILLDGTPYGPSSPADVADNAALKTGATLEIPWSQFSRTVLDVADFVERREQVPNAVWFGSAAVPPENYLAALAPVARTLLAKSEPPASVKVPPARLAAGKYVAEDSPALWSWPIFPEGFHSAHLMSLARLQVWTLKPALMQPPR